MNGWDKLLSSLDYYDLALDGWPGWDRVSAQPCYITIEIMKGIDKPSVNIATEFDDVSTGNFWYRDFTYSGIPFLDYGEEYQAMFVFQFKSDYIKFREMFASCRILEATSMRQIDA